MSRPAGLDRTYAQRALRRAIKDGRHRGAPTYCSICRNPGKVCDPIVPSWEDYGEPLQVRWGHQRCVAKLERRRAFFRNRPARELVSVS
jgi:hypothetical protein